MINNKKASGFLFSNIFKVHFPHSHQSNSAESEVQLFEVTGGKCAPLLRQTCLLPDLNLIIIQRGSLTMLIHSGNMTYISLRKLCYEVKN